MKRYNRHLGIFCFILFLGLGTNLQAQKIQWMTWEQAVQKSKVQKKKIFVDIYTDWCGWCKKMDKSTFAQPMIAKYVNQNFYPVKFNAEQRESIKLNNETFKFVNAGRKGYHELAFKLTKGRLSYPTIVFLDENLQVIQPIPGFQSATNFEMIMTYFSENHHKNTPWKKYTTGYKSKLK